MEKTLTILDPFLKGEIPPDLTLELYLHPLTGALVAVQMANLNLKPAPENEKNNWLTPLKRNK
jgi:hypothetical protein